MSSDDDAVLYTQQPVRQLFYKHCIEPPKYNQFSNRLYLAA